MSEAEVYKKENQRVSASEVLQNIAGGMEIKLSGCTISGSLDINRLFVKDENFDTKKVVTRTEDSKTVVTLAQLVSFNRCTFEGDVCFSSPWEKPGELEVVLPGEFKFLSVQSVDLRGRPLGKPLQVKGNSLSFELNAYAPASFVFQ